MKALIGLIMMLAVSGCARLSDRGFERAKLSSDAESSRVIRLADYTPFAWDRAHIFAPYTPPEVIKTEIGKSVPFPHGSSESHCLLVFLYRGSVAAALEVERQPADFSELYRKGGYPPDEAVFTVEVRGTHRWRYLKKNG